MKKKLLVLFSVVVLAVAGSVMAQTEPAPAGEPAPAAPEAEAAPMDTGTQPSSAQPPEATSPSTGSPEAAQPAQAETLPATASNAPLMMVIGALSLAAFTGLLIYRRRRTARS